MACVTRGRHPAPLFRLHLRSVLPHASANTLLADNKQELKPNRVNRPPQERDTASLAAQTTNNRRERVVLPTGSTSPRDLIRGRPTNVTLALRPSSPFAKRRGTMLNPCSVFVLQTNGHKVMVLLSCKSHPHTPGPHFERSLAVGCWQTGHVVQHLRKSCSFTEPRQSVGGLVARARMCFASSSSMPKLSNAKAISAASAPHERSG